MGETVIRARALTAGVLLLGVFTAAGPLANAAQEMTSASVRASAVSSAATKVTGANRCRFVDQNLQRTRAGNCPLGLASGSTVYQARGQVDFYSAMPVYINSTVPSTSDGITDAYTKFYSDFLMPHPEQWGDGYAENNVLIIQTVTRSVVAATALLKADGISMKYVKVFKSCLSSADVQRIQAKVMPTSATLSRHITSVGVDPKTHIVLVGIWASDHKLRRYLHSLHVGKIIAYAEGRAIAV